MNDPLLSKSARRPSYWEDSTFCARVMTPLMMAVVLVGSVYSTFNFMPRECSTDGDCHGFGCDNGRCNCSNAAVAHRWRCLPGAPYMEHVGSQAFMIVLLFGVLSVLQINDYRDWAFRQDMEERFERLER